MAGMNRYFFGVQSRKHAVKMIHGKAAIGASGAVTLDAGASSGILTMTKSATGTYEVALDGKLPQLVGFQCTLLDDDTNQISTFQLTSNTVATDGKLVFKCLAPTSSSVTTLVATNPTDGATLLFTVLVNNTSLDQ